MAIGLYECMIFVSQNIFKKEEKKVKSMQETFRKNQQMKYKEFQMQVSVTDAYLIKT